MEEQQRLEMGERIKLLRERSPYTQPVMAAKLHIGPRAYQKLEARGTERYERCEEVAKIHAAWTAEHPDWTFVNADWIWDGHRRDQTSDLMAALVSPEMTDARLGRIETRLDEIRSLLAISDQAAIARDEQTAALLTALLDQGSGGSKRGRRDQGQ